MEADGEVTPARRSLRALARLAARAAGASPLRVQGFVDALVHGDTVVGWARDPRDPTRRLEIQLLQEEQVVGFGLADLARRDLLAQNMGDGRYGFRIRLSPKLLDGAARKITVCAVTEKGKLQLQRGELTLGAPPREEQPPETLKNPVTMVGALERLTGRTLHGWAYNPDQPDTPAMVDVYDDERYLGSVIADRSRPRLYEKGFPSGARGFVFELPIETEGAAAGRLRGRVAGTSYDLRRSRELSAEPVPTSDTRPENDVAKQELPAAPPPIVVPRRSRELENADLTVALWILGPSSPATVALTDWSGQLHPAIRLATHDEPGTLPERLGTDAVRVNAGTAVQLARETAFVLFAPPGTRLDRELAGTVATLPCQSDVIVLGDGRPSWCGEAARAETYLAPTKPRVIAVRSDILPAYPGDLGRELGSGMLSPLALWLAGRRDLIWTTLAVPDITAIPEPAHEHRLEAWRTMLDDKEWLLEPATILPIRRPDRISIAQWGGWDGPSLSGLGAMIESIGTPLDILVPAEGDEQRAHLRLTEVDRLLSQSGNSGVRARIVDCQPGPLATIRALLDAADGDAVLLTDGSVGLTAADIDRLARWSLHAHIGVVGLQHPAGWSSGAVLESGLALRPAREAGVVDVVSFGLGMVAADRVAAVGLPEFGPDADLAHAALLWTRRMARHGFHSAVITGSVEASGKAAAAPHGPVPWHIEARLRAAGLLEGC